MSGDHSPRRGCCWPTPQGPHSFRNGVPRKDKLGAAPLKPREGALHAFPPQASCLLITLLSSSPRLPLGHPAFLATFGILLNTCDLWPLPSDLPTHLSPQLLPLLNSVRLAPPPVIKRRTFQVDTFPLSRPCVASPGAGQVSGPPRASWDCRQGQSLALLQLKSIRQNWTCECHRCGSTQAPSPGHPPTPHYRSQPWVPALALRI